MRRPQRLLPIAGFTVVLIVCAGILGAAAYNRSGAPESVLRLSERELEVPTGSASGRPENTPLTLRLVWRVESSNRFSPATTVASDTRAAWITPAKWAELDIPVPRRTAQDTFASTLLVLELAGDAYARTVSRACEAQGPAKDERACAFESSKASRLFVIDAGRSLTELRGRHPDRARYAIVRGVIKLSRDLNGGDVAGYVDSLSVEKVQSLEPLRSKIDPDNGEMAWHRLRSFTAVIAFGRRLEPWDVSIAGRVSEATNPDRPSAKRSVTAHSVFCGNASSCIG